MNTETIIKLPNGQSVRASAVIAVRCFNASDNIKPNVGICYGGKESHGQLSFFFDTNEERDAFAASITEQL